MTAPCDLSAIDARRLIGAKKLSPVELLESCLSRIERVNDTVNAVVAMDVERASREAAEAEDMVMQGAPLGPLHGLPVGIKDLQATEGLRTTQGSLIYRDHVPDLDDPMVANVRMAGGIVFAKTNTPEFGAGANTVNKVYGATRNPFDLTRSAAGSSGGTAVALATGMLPLATGTDYGGSLRLPASFNGIVGFRPSPGVVPHVNRSAPLSPWSVLGPMARTVADAYLLMQAQADRDKRDPFSGDDDHRLSAALTPVDLSSLRVAFSPDLGVTPIDAGIRASFDRKIATFRSSFAASVDRSPEFGDDVHESFRILRDVHFMAAHRQRVEQHRDLLGPNVIANTEDGKQFSLADVAWAMVEQGKIYKRFLSFFDDVDVLICPATSVTPYPLSDPFVRTINGQPMADYVRWAAITYALTTALPAAACITCGRDHEGMPFGLQVVGPNGSDAFIWRVAHTLEHVLATNPETARPVPDIDKLAQSAKGAK